MSARYEVGELVDVTIRGARVVRHDASPVDEPAYIASHLLFGMVMFSGTHNNPRDFKHFISGWAVRDGGESS